MAAKKAQLKQARDLFDLAVSQLDSAQTAWWEPAEPAACITNAFYAYENALTVVMLISGRKRTRKHYEKAQTAKELYEAKVLRTDVSDRLNRLNSVRKDVQYGELGFEMVQVNLEDLVTDLETFIEEVRVLLDGEGQ